MRDAFALVTSLASARDEAAHNFMKCGSEDDIGHARNPWETRNEALSVFKISREASPMRHALPRAHVNVATSEHVWGEILLSKF